MILRTLHNPIYAGAYVFGKSETARRLDAEGSQTVQARRVQRSEWPVLIRDHHPAYLSFEQFLADRERLRGNAQTQNPGEADEKGPAREGPVFEIDIKQCPRCSGTLKIIAAIEYPPVIAKILTHLGLPARAPPPNPRRGYSIDSEYLIRIRYPPPSGSSPRADNPPWPVPARDAETPGNIAPRADEGPEKSPILGRGLARSTAHEPSSTMPLGKKGRLKSLSSSNTMNL